MLLLIPVVHAVQINLPEPTGYVVDTIGLLKADTVASLTVTCKALDPVAQVAVVIVGSTQPWSIDQYSIKLAEKWKPGYKGKDNGVILIVAKDDHKMRVEVGRGLEGSINDAKAGRIISSMVPYFKAGDYDNGVLVGVRAIKQEIVK